MTSPQVRPDIFHRPSFRCGFTLIECLMVMGLLAILAILASGTMRTIREKSKTSQCTMNLRQLFLMVHSYAADHGGQLPRAMGVPLANGNRPSWYNTLEAGGQLAVYGVNGWSGKEKSIARCPARPDKAAHTNIKTSAGYFHYGMNNCPGGLDTITGPVRLGSITAPGQTFLIGESDARIWIGRMKGEPVQANHLIYPHQDGMNLVFADGHAEWKRKPLPEITSATVPPPAPWWGE